MSQDPQPTVDRDSVTAARMATLYDGVVADYIKAFWNDLTDAPWLDEFAQRVTKGGLILDVGCGPGNFAAYLAKQGFRLHGIDISPKMIEAARRLVPGHQFDVADCRAIGTRDQTYDGVLAAYSLLHLTRDGAIKSLQECFRVMRGGGKLALMLKEGTGQHELPASLSPGQTCFVQLWDREDAKRSLSRIGFRVIAERSGSPTSDKELQFTKFMLLCER